jgi:hypothetical protein
MGRFGVWVTALALAVGPAVLVSVGQVGSPTGAAGGESRLGTQTAPASGPSTAPRVIVLQIVRPMETADRDQILNDDPFSSSRDGATGVRLVIQAAMPAGAVEVPKSITLSTFSDDRGTDFGFGVRPKTFPSNQHSPVALTFDRQRCIIKLYSTEVPAQGASELRIKGTLPVRVGRGEKIDTQKEVVFRLGRTVEAGGMKLTIASLSEPYARSGVTEGLAIAFTSETPLTRLKSIEFLDEKGGVIPFKEEKRDVTANEDSKLAGLRGTLSSRPKSASVRVTTFEKVDSVDVPLDMTVKVGL